jgi:periplasmic divalent cation tolerance protein
LAPPAVRDAKLRGVLPVFVYGTLRPGSWNHDRCLAPWLAAPCRPATLAGHVLHHHRGLPYLVAAGDGAPGRLVAGHLADLDPARYDAALATLDDLEDVADRHYDRVEVTIQGGASAWVWLAGPRIAAELGPATVVEHGDFLRLAG